MKQKAKKPADDIIRSVLEDLKKSSDDSLVIGPEGIKGSDLESENLDSTAVLGSDYDSSIDSHDFRVDEQSAIEELRKKLEVPEREATSNESTLLLDEDGEIQDQSSTLQMPAGLIVDEPPKVEQNQQKANEETLVANPQRRDQQKVEPKVEPKVSFGGGKGKTSPFEAQFAQAQNLKMAQQRILELEKEVERLRKDNEVLSSASEISKQKIDDLVTQVYQLEKQKNDLREVNESELNIFKDGLAAKDSQILRLKNKVDELESRLSNDLKKVRVRERELENRLELAKAEKGALLRAKDDTILELKRKTENLEGEIEGYQNKIIELGQKLELNQEQFARTVRALRLALTNLEVSDGTSPSITLAPLKKAE